MGPNGTNEESIVEKTVPYINRLLKVAGFFALPKGTNASNILDRLEVLFSQIQGAEQDQQVNPQGLNASEELMAAMAGASEPATLSDRARPISPQQRQRQEIAARIAKQRNIPYIQALELVP